jgi:hypothetical protein
MNKTSQKISYLSLSTALLVGVSMVALSSAARAQQTLFDNKNGTTVIGTFTGITGFFGVGNADFGAGNQNTTNIAQTGPQNRKIDREWIEGSIQPGLSFATPSFLGGSYDKGSLYANFSVVGNGSLGSGDAVSSLTPNSLRSTTSDEPFHYEIENGNVGWQSGDTFKDSLGSNVFDLSYGDQGFVVGDGLVIDTGSTTGWRRSAYYTDQQVAFQRTVILKINPDSVPLRGNLFKLENKSNMNLTYGNDAPETKFYGFNTEYFKAGTATKDNPNPPDVFSVGLLAFHVYASDAPTLTAANTTVGQAFSTTTWGDRTGLNVYSVYGGGSFIPGYTDILLHGQYVGEHNGSSSGKEDADAWYIEPAYNFENLPWAPVLSVRYAHFSGETNVNGNVKHNYDPLFFGAGPRGYGSWYIGEVYGWYLGPPSNLNVWQIGVTSTPTDNTTFGIEYYNMAFAAHQYTASNAAMKSLDALNEVDINGSYTPDQFKFLTVSSVLGVGFAGRGFSQAASSYAQANTGNPAQPVPSTGAPMIVGELIATVKF